MGAVSHRLVDDLASHLRSRLLVGQYAPGERLSESGIAVEYGVARSTARAAIDALVTDGLLAREAHLPPRVTAVALEDLPEIFEILEVVERIALGRVLAMADERPQLSLASESAVAGLLNWLVITSGSDRLALLHRRLTFEFLLGVRQHGFADHAVDLAAERHGRRLLFEALTGGSAHLAADALHSLQQQRRAPLQGVIPFTSPHNGVARR